MLHSWDDYSVTIDESDTDTNLLLEVENLHPQTTGYRTDALSVHLFPQSIPPDRAARQSVVEAIDLVYSITIDSHHLQAFTYYIGVKCGATTATYRLRARGIPAAMSDGGHVSGQVCPGAWTYHYFQVASGSAGSDLQFRFRLTSGDATYMTQHQQPPLKLRPPYRNVDHSAHSAPGVYTEVNLCAAEEGRHFFALRGRSHCADYELHLDVVSHNSSCAEMVHECDGDDCGFQCDEIELDKFVYGECVPYSWYDFKLETTPEDAENNLVVTVEALSKFRTPELVSLHMYTDGEIPIDRHTEHRSMFAPDGVWGLGLSSHDLQSGTYFFSVHCGAEPARFRIFVELIQAAVHDGDLVAGEICPGQWIYHHYTVDSNALSSGAAAHIDFEIKLYTGDVEYMTRHEHPPIKLIPPYGETSASKQLQFGAETVSICNVEHGISYLGLHGGHHCSMYEVSAHVYSDSDRPCTAQLHTANAAAYGALEEVPLDHNLVRSCRAGRFVEFYIDLANLPGQSSPGINFAVEVEDLSEQLNPEALGLYLYDGEIPTNRETELRQEYSADGMYSVTVIATEVHAGRYFISVRCGDEPVRFRLLAHAIHAKLYPGDTVSGSVCPGSAMVHSFDMTQFPGLVVIDSDTLGQLSSVTISPTSGLHALDLVGFGTAIAGQDAAQPSAPPATSGLYTGASFTAYDFSSHNEVLVVSVDGHDQTVILSGNFARAGDAVTALSAGLTGVVVSEDHGNIVITSSSTGATSSVVLDTAQSGAHAVGLFGSGTAIAGSDAGPMGCGITPASAGSYRSSQFHPYNFAGREEYLVVVVDGTAQTFTLSTNVQTPDDVVAALQTLTGATAKVVAVANVEWSFVLHSGDAFYTSRHEEPPLLLAPPYRHAVFGHGDDHGYAEVCEIEHVVYFAMFVSSMLGACGVLLQSNCFRSLTASAHSWTGREPLR